MRCAQPAIDRRVRQARTGFFWWYGAWSAGGPRRPVAKEQRHDLQAHPRRRLSRRGRGRERPRRRKRAGVAADGARSRRTLFRAAGGGDRRAPGPRRGGRRRGRRSRRGQARPPGLSRSARRARPRTRPRDARRRPLPPLFHDAPHHEPGRDDPVGGRPLRARRPRLPVPPGVREPARLHGCSHPRHGGDPPAGHRDDRRAPPAAHLRSRQPRFPHLPRRAGPAALHPAAADGGQRRAGAAVRGSRNALALRHLPPPSSAGWSRSGPECPSTSSSGSTCSSRSG